MCEQFTFPYSASYTRRHPTNFERIDSRKMATPSSVGFDHGLKEVIAV